MDVKALDCIKGVVRLVGASQNEDNNDRGHSFYNDPILQWILKKTTISPLLSKNLPANNKKSSFEYNLQTKFGRNYNLQNNQTSPKKGGVTPVIQYVSINLGYISSSYNTSAAGADVHTRSSRAGITIVGLV